MAFDWFWFLHFRCRKEHLSLFMYHRSLLSFLALFRGRIRGQIPHNCRINLVKSQIEAIIRYMCICPYTRSAKWSSFPVKPSSLLQFIPTNPSGIGCLDFQYAISFCSSHPASKSNQNFASRSFLIYRSSETIWNSFGEPQSPSTRVIRRIHNRNVDYEPRRKFALTWDVFWLVHSESGVFLFFGSIVVIIRPGFYQ